MPTKLFAVNVAVDTHNVKQLNTLSEEDSAVFHARDDGLFRSVILFSTSHLFICYFDFILYLCRFGWSVWI